jgi:glucose-1-phosphate adenylyltransferase
MGIYVFRTDVLRRVLEGTQGTDFGREIIPQSIVGHRVQSFLHGGYWRDIGTIPSFHEASLDLTRPLPPLNLYDPEFPIYTHARFLPGTKINRCHVEQSILCEGSIITEATVSNSIVGIRAVVRPGAVIEDSVVFGARRFEAGGASGAPALGIGRDVRIRRAIVDFDARIGDGSRILNERGVQEADAESYCIRGGIVVVPRSAVLPPGTVV